MSKYCKVQNRPEVMAKIIKNYVGNILSKTLYVPYLNQNVRMRKIVHSRDCGKCVAEGNNLYDKMVVRGIGKASGPTVVGPGSIVGL